MKMIILRPETKHQVKELDTIQCIIMRLKTTQVCILGTITIIQLAFTHRGSVTLVWLVQSIVRMDLPYLHRFQLDIIPQVEMKLTIVHVHHNFVLSLAFSQRKVDCIVVHLVVMGKAVA